MITNIQNLKTLLIYKIENVAIFMEAAFLF